MDIKKNRLIYADELKRRIIAFATGCNTTYLTVDNIIMLLNQADTVDAVPVDDIRLHYIRINSDGVPEVKLQFGDRFVTLRTDPVDVAEVKHGRWEWYTDRCEDLFLGCDEDYGWRCSHCKTSAEEWVDNCDDPETPPVFNYCPNCGADMRERET